MSKASKASKIARKASAFKPNLENFKTSLSYEGLKAASAKTMPSITELKKQYAR